jgi:protein-disulfide isomerase
MLLSALLLLPIVTSAQVSPAVLPIPAVTHADHILGPETASISVIEYADLECPYCAMHERTMQELLQKHLKDVRLVFRHFPLSFHPDSLPAMRSAECVASLKGNDAFWQYIDDVFENGVQGGGYIKAARALDINDSQLQTCLNDATQIRSARAILRMERRLQSTFSGTPTTFIVNQRTGTYRMLVGAQPMENFEEAIAELK